MTPSLVPTDEDGAPVTTPTSLPPLRGSRLDAWLTRHGVTGTSRRDAAFAAVVAAVGAVLLPTVLWLGAESDGVPVGSTTVALLSVVCAVQCVPLAVRRTRPATCLLLVAALQVVLVAVTPQDVGVRGAAPLLAAYAVATVLPGRTAARLVAAAVALELVGTVAVTVPAGTLLEGLAGVLSGAVTYAGAALVGSNVRTRRRYLELVRRRAAELEATQEERVRTAIAGVRSSMARELHDIAAHHLSAMVVQATATARLVDRDPAAAKEGLLAIRGQGRRTLEDLRLLVGVLRDPATAEAGAPVPGLGMLDDLVAEARGLGADVRVERVGDPAPLGPLADVTAYRLAQEALSNARQHAPGATVLVEVRTEEDRLVLTVTNDRPLVVPAPAPAGARSSDGVGLLGMRERVQLSGGRLQVGATSAGGWRVRAELPTEGGAT